VHIITKKRIREFSAQHPDAKMPLTIWYHLLSKTTVGSFAELKALFRSVDQVGTLAVFNIGGNKYRLIAAVHYNRKIVYIRHILTHAEYDRNKWRA